MKKFSVSVYIFTFSVVSFLFVLGCENNPNAHDGYSADNEIALSLIRDVAEYPVTDCAIEQVHQHDGAYYSGHYNNDGHGHSGLRADNTCTINSCTKTDLHQHNGVHYTGHNNTCCGHGGHGNVRHHSG
jgi:hypothetical protein